MFSVVFPLSLLAVCAYGSQKSCSGVGKPAFGSPGDVATISSSDGDDIVVAPTGLASSGTYADVLYFINGGTADENLNTVYAINADSGEVIGGINITDAVNMNWQGLAVQVCPEAMDGYCIYVHDVESNTVYIVQEESNPASFVSKAADKTIVYTFKTEDTGPRNSRSLFVDCQGGVYFFDDADRGRGVRLYQIIKNDDNTYTATPKFQLNIPTVTYGPVAASLSHDCCELVVKTEDKIYYYPWVDMMPQKEHARLLPAIINPYGQSIAWALNGSGFFTALESAPLTISFSPRNKNVPESKFSLGKVIGGVAMHPFRELAGVAASRKHPGILYMISDETITDVLVVQMCGGQAISRYSNIDDKVFSNVDWEDIAVGPSFEGMPGSSSIYINDGGRDSGGPENIIHILPETDDPYVDIEFYTCQHIHYRYHGRHFESHAVMVGCDGEIYVFSYVRNFGDPVNVFRLINTDGHNYAAVVIATFPNPSLLPGPKAADISSCCDEILVKFRDGVYKYSLENNDVARAFLNDATSLPYIPEINGASVAITTDCNAYVTIEDQGHTSPAPLKKYERISCCKNNTAY
ncbi:uncharacterized protein [Haliotis asinina]|uniref:uncharacterized protein n=1 Tax=Haliotis asinina TaxID=109174 RepID=UPI0035327EC4